MLPHNSLKFGQTPELVVLLGSLLVCHAFPALADGTQPTTPLAPAPPRLVVPPNAVIPPRLSEPPVLPSNASDARTFLQLLRVQDVCKLPLDLKVMGATVEDVAEQVQKKKLALSPVPSIKRLYIEVRNVRPIRTDFAAKGSTVGGVLNSIAFLSGARVWVFTDYLLIAPEEALTAKEHENKQLDFQQLNGTQLSPEIQRAFANFISEEIKGIAGSDSPKADSSLEPNLLSKTTFDQLSPDAQAMLQRLVDSGNKINFNLAQFQPLVLTPGASVGITSDNHNSLAVSVPMSETSQSIFRLSWGLDGRSAGASAGGGTNTPGKAPSHPGAPFVDPSAGKS